MNKKLWLVCILSIVVGFVTLPIITVQASEKNATISLSPYVDRVRDTYGNPLQKNTNYILQVFNTDTSQSKPYYVYDSYGMSIYDWLWLQEKPDNAFSVQINNKSEVLTDGIMQYILNGTNGVGEVVRWGSDGTYTHGGLYWGSTGHNDRYGFRRIEGDRDYKYLLTNNYGSIEANFVDGTITTLGSDKPFVISFQKQ